jgi:ribosomal protein S14
MILYPGSYTHFCLSKCNQNKKMRARAESFKQVSGRHPGITEPQPVASFSGGNPATLLQNEDDSTNESGGKQIMRCERCGREGSDICGPIILCFECLALIAREWKVKHDEFGALAS